MKMSINVKFRKYCIKTFILSERQHAKGFHILGSHCRHDQIEIQLKGSRNFSITETLTNLATRTVDNNKGCFTFYPYLVNKFSNRLDCQLSRKTVFKDDRRNVREQEMDISTMETSIRNTIRILDALYSWYE